MGSLSLSLLLPLDGRRFVVVVVLLVFFLGVVNEIKHD